jgi:hypothetical protein
VWLEEPAPHAPVSQYQHNRTGEDACGVAVPRFASPLRGASRGPLPCARPQDWPGLCPERRDRNADPHLKRNATRSVARDGARRAAVVVVTNGRLDGSTERSTWRVPRTSPEGSPKSLAPGSGSFTANSMAGGGNGCWSTAAGVPLESSGSSGNQGYPESNRMILATQWLGLRIKLSAHKSISRVCYAEPIQSKDPGR